MLIAITMPKLTNNKIGTKMHFQKRSYKLCFVIITRIKVRILKLIFRFELHPSDGNVTYQIQKLNLHYILYIKLTSSKKGETSSAILFRSTLRKYFCLISNAHTQFQRRSLTARDRHKFHGGCRRGHRIKTIAAEEWPHTVL